VEKYGRARQTTDDNIALGFLKLFWAIKIATQKLKHDSGWAPKPAWVF